MPTQKKQPLEIVETLNATVRMIRQTWKTSTCLFLQTDDHGSLRVRASDGLPAGKRPPPEIKPKEGIVAECLKTNQVLESGTRPWDEGLEELFERNGHAQGKKYVVIPVAGQSRVLGAMILGPFAKSKSFKEVENELRSAGTLCAVLSAYLRLYEWTRNFLPQLNHDVRTPLSAVQGSVGMILGGVFGDVGQEVKSMLEIANRGCSRTVQAIEEFIGQQNLPKP